MRSEGLFCIRRVAQLRASQKSQAVPPCCPPLTPVLQPLESMSSILLLSLIFPTSYQLHGSQNAALPTDLPSDLPRPRRPMSPSNLRWRQGSNAVRVPWLSPGFSRGSR